jgi:hypothetical protein
LFGMLADIAAGRETGSARMNSDTGSKAMLSPRLVRIGGLFPSSY